MKQQQTQQSPEENTLTEQAATWFLRIQQSDCSDADQKAFEVWLAASEANRAEYQQYTQLWQNLDQLERKPKQSPSKKAYLAITSVMMLMLMFGSLQWLSDYEQIHTTAVGDRHQITLADGTTIDMNTDTVIRVALWGYSRKVTLERGEASFKIGDERFRSFVVFSGNGTLRDIGTEFNVTKETDKTTVSVLEGAVEVTLDNQSQATKLLYGGQQLTYSNYDISSISPVNAEATVAWHKDRLIFRELPLDEVVQQINRYHVRPIRLGDQQLSQLKVSGEFNSTDRAGLVQALKTLLSLRSSEQNDVTVLHSAK